MSLKPYNNLDEFFNRKLKHASDAEPLESWDVFQAKLDQKREDRSLSGGSEKDRRRAIVWISSVAAAFLFLGISLYTFYPSHEQSASPVAVKNSSLSAPVVSATHNNHPQIVSSVSDVQTVTESQPVSQPLAKIQDVPVKTTATSESVIVAAAPVLSEIPAVNETQASVTPVTPVTPVTSQPIPTTPASDIQVEENMITRKFSQPYTLPEDIIGIPLANQEKTMAHRLLWCVGAEYAYSLKAKGLDYNESAKSQLVIKNTSASIHAVNISADYFITSQFWVGSGIVYSGVSNKINMGGYLISKDTNMTGLVSVDTTIYTNGYVASYYDSKTGTYTTPVLRSGASQTVSVMKSKTVDVHQEINAPALYQNNKLQYIGIPFRTGMFIVHDRWHIIPYASVTVNYLISGEKDFTYQANIITVGSNLSNPYSLVATQRQISFKQFNLMYNAGIRADFMIRRNLAVSAGADYKYIPSYLQNSSPEFSRTGISMWNLSAGIRYYLVR